MIIAPLGENRALCYDKFFPSPFRPSSKRYEVVIGVGGNLGEVPRSLQRLFRALQKAKRVDIISTSPLYYNPAFGYAEQAPFYNATMRLGWSGGYGEFFAYTSYLESALDGLGSERLKTLRGVLISTFSSLMG